MEDILIPVKSMLMPGDYGYDSELAGRIDHISTQDLVKLSCKLECSENSGELEKLRDKHDHMLFLFGGLLELLISKKFIVVSDLKEIFYDLGELEIVDY